MAVKSPNEIAQRAGFFLDQAFPGANRDKRIAQRLDISPNMAGLLRRGQGWTVERLGQLRELGGAAMVDFVFGRGAGVAALAPAVPYNQAADQFRADQFFWATADGALHHAPHGHAAFARAALGETGADLSDFACRMFGWVALTQRADLTLDVRYTEGQAARPAAARACEFIRDNRQSLRTVRRIVGAGHDWIAAAPASPGDAEQALALAADLGTARFEVERLPLGMADEFPQFRALLQAKAQLAATPGALFVAASTLLPGAVSLVDVEGDNVVVLKLGSRLGLDHRRQGVNVMGWSDTRYAGVTRRRMQEARAERAGAGATLYRFDVPLEGAQTDYLTMALPDGDSSVIAASIVRHRERLAA
jgi:hypothetical protein